MTLVETTYREKRGEREVLQNYQHDKGDGVRKETFVFISRLNIVHRDSYQEDEIVVEIEEWKQMFFNTISILTCNRYDSYLNAVTHIYNVFPGKMNTYHPGQNIWK